MARNGDRKVAIFPDRSAPFAYSTLSSSAQCGPVAARVCAGPACISGKDRVRAPCGRNRHPKLLRTNTVIALVALGQRCPRHSNDVSGSEYSGARAQAFRPCCAVCRYLFKSETTLCGGSLGSCVDEERSQLRELM